MKKTLVLFALALTAAFGCNQGPKTRYLPSVSGKAGEVIVVIQKGDWEDALGECVRRILAADCPYLPVREPLYTLVNVAPSAFNNLFNVHRNIVVLNIGAKADTVGVEYLKDAWASPQCLVRISAPDTATACSLLRQSGAKIIDVLEQAERERVISGSLRYENKDLGAKVRKTFGGSVRVPNTYHLVTAKDNFIWLQSNGQGDAFQALVFYKYPAEQGVNELELDRILARRDEFMKAYVSGPVPGSYGKTAPAESFPPYIEYLKYKGRDFAQTRGMWELEGDFMGGPFVSEAFYSRDGKEVIVTEGCIYLPGKDKRLNLRQVESLLYSWEWSKNEE
ncbi:MAG: DUF4837 family protein [Bacteroidales bacterium]|nr:DUF4837 family protein [Bacteroidales bacterium]